MKQADRRELIELEVKQLAKMAGALGGTKAAVHSLKPSPCAFWEYINRLEFK